MTLIDRLRFEPAMVAAGILAALAFAGVAVRSKVVPVDRVAAAVAAAAVVDPPEFA